MWVPGVGVAVVLGPPQRGEDGHEREGEEAEDEGADVAVTVGEEVGHQARAHWTERGRGREGEGLVR